VSTVSRVLNGKASSYRISPDTEALVQSLADELQYRPNHVARGLRLKTTLSIGLLAPDVSNPFFASIIKRAQKVAHDLGYSLIVCNTDESEELEIEHVNLLYRKRVDGLIAMPVGQTVDHFAEWCDRGIPLVLLDRCFDGLDVPSVVVDNYAGAYEAVDLLIKAGHRQIAIVQGLPGTYTSGQRMKGYESALADSGIEVDERLIVGGDFRQQNGYVGTRLLLAMAERPTAIFATGDLIALGALEAIYEAGLTIPADVSLLSFDDFEFAPFLKCPLTAVSQPKEMMAEVAVKLLVDRLSGRPIDENRVILKPGLVERESVGPPPWGQATA
jgi:LacI family transcriptional regulator